jgi:hypothetical protein
LERYDIGWRPGLWAVLWACVIVGLTVAVDDLGLHFASLSAGDPEELLAVTASLFSVIVTWLIAGLLLSPWGARDEPFGRTLVRSLQHLLVVAPWGAALALLLVLVDLAVADWEVVDDYGSGTWTRPHPLAVLTQTLTAIGVGVAGAAIMLWAVTAGRALPHGRWPAACQRCGYNLTALPEHVDDCPECGEPVAAATDPASRPGVRGQERWRFWRPAELGRSLWVWQRRPRVWRQVLWLLGMGAVMTGLWMLLMGIGTDGDAFAGEYAAEAIGWVMLSQASIGLYFAFWWVSMPLWVGLVRGWTGGVRCLAAASAAAGLLWPVMLLWQMLSIVGIGGFMLIAEQWDTPNNEVMLIAIGLSLGAIYFLGLPVLLFVLLWRITGTARWANW